MSRKQKQYHFIYKTTDTRNGNFYIGMHSTDDLNDGYVGSGLRLKRLKYKYGKEIFNVDILEFLPDRESLKKREEEIVNSDLIKEDKCMNLVIGGQGGFYFTKEEHRKISILGGNALSKKLKEDKTFYENFSSKTSNLRKNEYLIGKRTTPINFIYSFLNKTHTDSTKKIIAEKNSITQHGEKNSQFGTCWINNGIENKKIKKDDLLTHKDWSLGRIMTRKMTSGLKNFNK